MLALSSIGASVHGPSRSWPDRRVTVSQEKGPIPPPLQGDLGGGRRVTAPSLSQGRLHDSLDGSLFPAVRRVEACA